MKELFQIIIKSPHVDIGIVPNVGFSVGPIGLEKKEAERFRKNVDSYLKILEEPVKVTKIKKRGGEYYFFKILAEEYRPNLEEAIGFIAKQFIRQNLTRKEE